MARVHEHNRLDESNTSRMFTEVWRELKPGNTLGLWDVRGAEAGEHVNFRRFVVVSCKSGKHSWGNNTSRKSIEPLREITWRKTLSLWVSNSERALCWMGLCHEVFSMFNSLPCSNNLLNVTYLCELRSPRFFKGSWCNSKLGNMHSSRAHSSDTVLTSPVDYFWSFGNRLWIFLNVTKTR